MTTLASLASMEHIVSHIQIRGKIHVILQTNTVCKKQSESKINTGENTGENTCHIADKYSLQKAK